MPHLAFLVMHPCCEGWCPFTWKQYCVFVQYLITVQCAFIVNFGLAHEYSSSEFSVLPHILSVRHKKCGLCIVFTLKSHRVCVAYGWSSFLYKLCSICKTQCCKMIFLCISSSAALLIQQHPMQGVLYPEIACSKSEKVPTHLQATVTFYRRFMTKATLFVDPQNDLVVCNDSSKFLL